MKNKVLKIFIFFWVLLFSYLLIMNSGLLGLTINYNSQSHHALISDFWPRSNYIVEGENIILIKDSIYLDLKPQIEFQNLEIYIEMEEIESMEVFVKESFESEVLIFASLENKEWTKIHLGGLSKTGLLVLPLPLDCRSGCVSARGLKIKKLKLKFKDPSWLFK